MNRASVLLPILLAAIALSAADWTSIQPGPSLEGWTRVPIPPDAPLDAATQWSVDPSTSYLVCDGAKEKGHEWLRYDRELKNFVLHVEWRFRKLEPGAKYNSGVFVRNSKDGAEWWQAQVSGPENAGFFFWDEMVDGARKRVSLKSRMPSNPLKEAGEWNTYEIRAAGPNVSLTVNGIETSSFQCPRLTGYVGLEAEHFHLEFRNVKVRELP